MSVRYSATQDCALWPGLSQQARVAIVSACAFVVSALVVVNSGGFSPIRPVAWSFGGVLGLNALPLADRAQTLASLERAEPGPDNPAVMRTARSLAIAALRRDPLISPAWRALALVETSTPGGRAERAFDLLRVSSFVSRRDTGTSALLFDAYVRRGEMTAGLRQLDFAMRRSPQARQALLPVLAQGLVNPTLRRALVTALEGKVSWRGDLLRQLALTPPADDALIAFLRQMSPDVMRENRADLYLVAAGLVQNGRLSAARALAQRLLVARSLVANGGFEQDNSAPPLDWALQASADFDAVQGTYGGSGDGAQALYVRSRRAQDAEVARQILFLPPGPQEISALSGTQGGDRAASVSIAVACVGPSNSVGEGLARLQLSAKVERRSVSARFSVPATGCPAQWLLIMVGGGATDGEVASWIDNVAIRSIGKGPRQRSVSVSE